MRRSLCIGGFKNGAQLICFTPPLQYGCVGGWYEAGVQCGTRDTLNPLCHRHAKSK